MSKLQEKLQKVANDFKCAIGWWVGLGLPGHTWGALLEHYEICNDVGDCMISDSPTLLGEILQNTPDFWLAWSLIFWGLFVLYATIEYCGE